MNDEIVRLDKRGVEERFRNMRKERATGGEDTGRMFDLIGILDPSGTAPLSKALPLLFPKKKQDPADDDFRKFRSRVNKQFDKVEPHLLSIQADPRSYPFHTRTVYFHGSLSLLDRTLRASDKTGPFNPDYDPAAFIPQKVNTTTAPDVHVYHYPQVTKEFMETHAPTQWQQLDPAHQEYLLGLLLKFEPMVQLLPTPAAPAVRGFEILGLGPTFEPYHGVKNYCRNRGIPGEAVDTAFFLQGLKAAALLLEQWRKIKGVHVNGLFFGLNINRGMVNHLGFPALLEAYFSEDHKKTVVLELYPDMSRGELDLLAEWKGIYDLRFALDRVEQWQPQHRRNAVSLLKPEWAKVSAETGRAMLMDKTGREKETAEELAAMGLDRLPLVVQGMEQRLWGAFLERQWPRRDADLWAQGYATGLPAPFDGWLRQTSEGEGPGKPYLLCGPPIKDMVPGPGSGWECRGLEKEAQTEECLERIKELNDIEHRNIRRLNREKEPWPYDPDKWVRARVNGVDALDVLFRWLEDKSTPFCAVLGEYGTGKTFLVRMFRSLCVEAVRAGKPFPVPLLLDFKLLGPLNKREKMPELEEIIEDILRAQGVADLPGRRVLELAHLGKIFLIFDGIDEQTVSLTPREAYHFWRQLRRAVKVMEADARIKGEKSGPAMGGGGNGGGMERERERHYTKAVLTCRTHYFKDFKDRDGQMAGQGLEGFRFNDRDFTLAVLNLFDRDMIADYITRTMGEGHREEVLAFIDKVYNLKDLAERPYLLSLMVEHFSELREQIARGRGAVTAAGLYELVTDSWFARDYGKHNLQPWMKMELMEELAFYMWQEDVSVINIPGMERWLTGRLAHFFPGMAPSADDLSLKSTDFRTATFIGWADEEGNFRFLHRSMMEFFLAKRMMRLLEEGKSAAESWDIPRVSREAWSFLVDLLGGRDRGELKGALRRDVEAVLESDYRERVSDNALALMSKWHDMEPGTAPRPMRLGLAGCRNLVGLEIADLDLVQLDIRGAVLVDMGFRRLSCLSVRAGDAVMHRVEWEDLELKRLETPGADIGGGRFSQCSADFWGGENTKVAGVEFVQTHVKEMRLPGAKVMNASFARCRMEALELKGASVRHTAFVRTFADGLPDHPPLHDSNRQIQSRGFPGLPDENGAPTLPGQFTGHGEHVLCLAYSPDGTQFISGSPDHTIKIWDAQKDTCLNTLKEHSGRIWSLQYYPDGTQFISASSDSTIKIWDAHNGTCLNTLKEHSGTIWSLQYSPDGTQFISASSDHTIKIWDAPKGTCLNTLNAHSGPVAALHYAPDGTQFISASSDSTIKLWDAEAFALLKTLILLPENQFAVFDHRTGKYTAYSKHAHRYVGWNLGTLRLPLETFEE